MKRIAPEKRNEKCPCGRMLAIGMRMMTEMKTRSIERGGRDAPKCFRTEKRIPIISMHETIAIAVLAPTMPHFGMKKRLSGMKAMRPTRAMFIGIFPYPAPFKAYART